MRTNFHSTALQNTLVQVDTVDKSLCASLERLVVLKERAGVLRARLQQGDVGTEAEFEQEWGKLEQDAAEYNAAGEK